MCSCKNKPSYRKALKQAQQFTNRLVGTWVVYKDPTSEKLVVGKESQVKKIEGVCCYTLPSGKEVENKKVVRTRAESKKETKKKQVPSSSKED